MPISNPKPNIKLRNKQEIYMRKKIRKCAYARVSTNHEEQESSLAFQTQYYKALIESEKDSEFVGIYADTKSGKTARLRKQFKAMIQAAKREEIDYIITKSISRFARNLVETLKIIRELREIGVGVYFEKENIDTLDYKSDFIISIYSLVAESELKSMGDQVKWAARKRFKNGSVELSPSIYGYTLKDGKLVPVPNEAAIVKEIFEKYAAGMGADSIAKSLNDRGFRTKLTQNLWRSNTILQILDNEKYIGDAILQKTYGKDYKRIKNDGSVPMYYVENNHEPIISKELFEKVQAIRERKKASAKRKPAKISPFSGKIKCAECGRSYKRRMNNRNTPYEKWIWSCRTYVEMGRKYCKGPNIREKDLQQLFVSAYNEAAKFQPHEIKNLDEALKDLLAQERDLIALKVKGYIKQEDYMIQHDELLSQIKETEEELMRQSQSMVKLQERADGYSDRLVACLEEAIIEGYTITFRFKNRAEIKREFNNDVDRRATWIAKKGVISNEQ